MQGSSEWITSPHQNQMVAEASDSRAISKRIPKLFVSAGYQMNETPLNIGTVHYFSLSNDKISKLASILISSSLTFFDNIDAFMIWVEWWCYPHSKQVLYKL